MIAPSRSAGYRRFYLYSALSMAVVASAVAATLLLRVVLLGLSGLRVSADETSRNVSLAVALLAIALPVGAAHLWSIARSHADPGERSAGVRHQYLNLWVAFGLLVMLFAGQAAFASQVPNTGADVTGQVSLLTVAAIVAAIAAWWISRTPPASPQPRIRSAVVVMLVAMAVAAFSIANAATGAGWLWQNGWLPFTPIQLHQEGAFRSGLLGTGLALLIWSLAFTWQRTWTDSRDRLGYALLGYGIGVTALLIGLAFCANGAISFARDPRQPGPFITAWPGTAAGALLVAVQATLLLRDRGHNGHPPVTTTRLLLAFPAFVGLGSLVAGLGILWRALLERDVVTTARMTDDLVLGAALALIGAAAYLPAWRAFDARSTAESAVRRFYLFTVVCLALAGGLVSAVVIVYNAITALVHVGAPDAPLTALTAILPAVLLGGVFAAHLRLLLHDQRLTRATEGVAVEPLVALLEEVRAGRVSVEAAAARLRLPATSGPHPGSLPPG